MFGRFHVTGSTTDCGLVSGTTTSDDTCTPSSGQFTPAAAMTGRDMSVHTDGGAGAVVTLQLNDTDTALTCTTDANGRCHDTTHTVAIPADSHLRFSASNPSGVGLNVQVAWRGTG
jgi:hypothetical protein